MTAYGYAFVEDDRPGRFDADAARALGVPEGPAFGRLQRGEEVGGVRPEQVVGPTRPGRRIVISGDTRPCQRTEVYAHGAEVLVHEATFLEDERARARETAHSTAAQAAELARDAGVRLLALTHLSTRYFPRDVRDEARAVFPDTVVPRDFDAIDVPFPERGEPALVKAEREPAPAPLLAEELVGAEDAEDRDRADEPVVEHRPAERPRAADQQAERPPERAEDERAPGGTPSRRRAPATIRLSSSTSPHANT